MQQKMASICGSTWSSLPRLRRCQCLGPSQLRRLLKLPPPPRQHPRLMMHTDYSQGNNQDEGLKKLRLYKRIFAISLFTGTLVFAWYLKKQKGLKLKELLEDFTRLPIAASEFGSNLSLYRYKGYVFPGQLVMSGVFKELPSFQFKQDDIVVASYPKAGTTWIQEIVYMLTHDFKSSNAKSEVLETRFPYLEYPYPGIKTLTAMQGPRYIKTHLPLSLLPPSFLDSHAKLIYIYRNPRDTAVSYYYFMQLLTQCSYQGSFSDFVKLFLSDLTMYSPFFDHVLGYWNAQHNPNILFVSYEELHQDPMNVIKDIAAFLNVVATTDELKHVVECTSFGVMSANPSVNYEHWKDLGFAHKNKGRFLRKGEVGNWQTHLSKDEVAAFKEWENKHLLNTGLSFMFEESSHGKMS